MIESPNARRLRNSSRQIYQIINTDYNKELLIKNENTLKTYHVPDPTDLGCCCAKCKITKYNTFDDNKPIVLKSKVPTSKL